MRGIIYKYAVPIDEDFFELCLPKGAEILSVQTQGNKPCIWALVDPGQSKEQRSFCLVGTGHPIIDDREFRFVGTFQIDDDTIVGHVFEIIKD